MWPKEILNSKDDFSKGFAYENDSEADQVLSGVHLVEASEGRREWELWAETAISLKEESKWNLKNVKINFIKKDNVSVVVYGKDAEIKLDNKNLKIFNNVKIVSINGNNFYSDEVTYQSKGKKIISPGEVLMNTKKDSTGSFVTVEGDKMEGDIDGGVFWILGNVSSVKEVDEEGRKIDIKSNKSLIGANDNKIEFFDDVLMDWGSVRISGPKAKFVFDKKKNSFYKVEASGGIRLSDLDKWASAESVIANIKENKITFRGAPRVVQGESDIRGDEIIFLNGGEEIKVKNIKAKLKDESIIN